LLGKLALGVAALAAAVVLFVVLRPDDSEGTRATSARETTTQGETRTEDDGGTTASTPDAPVRRVIRLTVRADEPEIERVDVDLDELVLLVVRADVSDEVHVHGYDLMSDVTPDRPARIAFRATIAGEFEVELEDSGRQIAQLTVQ
jgi:hypothetical protein